MSGQKRSKQFLRPTMQMHFPPYNRRLDTVRRRLIARGIELSNALFPTKAPVVILQMGKVGSTSLAHAVRQTGAFSVFAVHLLNRESIEAHIQRCQRASTYTFRHLINSMFLNQNVIGKSKNLKVITLVRDPIAWNVSAFFQNLLFYAPEYSYKNEDNEDTIEIINRFFCSDIHDFPLNYFDHEAKKPLDLDVYAHKFPSNKGYQIIRAPHVDLLAMQFEADEATKTDAIREFLCIPSISLPRLNQSKQKHYAELYKRVLESISFPEEYIDRMYKSKYVKHFYSAHQIQYFRTRWSRNPNE